MKLDEIKTNKVNVESINRLCQTYEIKNFSINDDGSIDVIGEVMFHDRAFKILPLKFNKVTGMFSVHNCPKLESLEGFPKKVTQELSIWKCQHVTSLEHLTPWVGGRLSLSTLPITTLDNISSHIGGSINLYNCSFLESLKGLPTKIDGDFAAEGLTRLKSWEHMPSEIDGFCKITINDNITKFEHLPKRVSGFFRIFSVAADNRLPFNVLALFKIKGIKDFIFHTNDTEEEIEKIINKYLPTGDIIECQEELIEAGFKEYARIK